MAMCHRSNYQIIKYSLHLVKSPGESRSNIFPIDVMITQNAFITKHPETCRLMLPFRQHGNFFFVNYYERILRRNYFLIRTLSDTHYVFTCWLTIMKRAHDSRNMSKEFVSVISKVQLVSHFHFRFVGQY